MPNLIHIYFLPPAAVGRLGGSSRPLENFEWRADPTVHGAAQNVIEPATTLDVAEDGTVTPYRPDVIRFRDGVSLRPVAPFFELWALIQYREDDPHPMLVAAGAKPGEERDVPLTASLLRAMGGAAASISYTVHLGNRKAARRTGHDGDRFEAVVHVRGDDHERKPLLACTPPQPGVEPLVWADRRIPLGTFQVMRPVRRTDLGIDLDVLRVRYTPATGQVYGPPSAIEAVGTTIPSIFEIAPPANRMLNPKSEWLRYDGSYSKYTNPEPWDTYDGADQDQNIAWGVVDDTCDGTIEASVVVRMQRYTAAARLLVGPPDYAPDRRPFLSLADDLADRDNDPMEATLAERDAGMDELKTSVADLFERVFETASLINLDGIRRRAINDNGAAPVGEKPPYTDNRSMTTQDEGYADDRVKAIVPDAPVNTLRFTPLVSLAHSPLSHRDELWSFLRNQAERARVMLRPAYAQFADLAEQAGASEQPSPEFRDPRNPRDQEHDMRMPPYMRDEMARALSLTRRQYIEVLRLIDALEAKKPSTIAARALPDAADVAGEYSALRQRVRRVLARSRAYRKPHA